MQRGRLLFGSRYAKAVRACHVMLESLGLCVISNVDMYFRRAFFTPKHSDNVLSECLGVKKARRKYISTFEITHNPNDSSITWQALTAFA